MKTINVRPVEMLGLEFDGEIKECMFSAKAVYILSKEFEGVQEIFKQAEDDMYKACSKLVYGGMKACDETVTFKEAETIVNSMSPSNLTELIDFVNKTIGDQSEKKKKVVPMDHQKKNTQKKKKKQKK